MAGKEGNCRNKGNKQEWPRAGPNSTLPPAPPSLPPKPPSLHSQPPTMVMTRDSAGGDSGSDDMDLDSEDSGPASSPIVQTSSISKQPAIFTSGISNPQTTNNNNMDSNDNKGKAKAKDPLEAIVEEAVGTSTPKASASPTKTSTEFPTSQPKAQATYPLQTVFQITGTSDTKSLSDKILASVRLRAAEKEAQESSSSSQPKLTQKATSNKFFDAPCSSSSKVGPSDPSKPSSTTRAPVASPKVPIPQPRPTKITPGLANWVGTNTGARSLSELSKIIEASANQAPPTPTLFDIETYRRTQTSSYIKSERAKNAEVERKKQAGRDLNHHFTDGRKIDHLFKNLAGDERGVERVREKTVLEVVTEYQKAQAKLRDLRIKEKTAAQRGKVIEEQRRERSQTLEPEPANDNSQDQDAVMGNTGTVFPNMGQSAASSSAGLKATATTTNPKGKPKATANTEKSSQPPPRIPKHKHKSLPRLR